MPDVGIGVIIVIYIVKMIKWILRKIEWLHKSCKCLSRNSNPSLMNQESMFFPEHQTSLTHSCTY